MASAEEVNAALEAFKARCVKAATETVSQGAVLVQNNVRKAASGPPGPNVITGSLVRGISASGVTQTGAFSWSASVSTTVVYGRIQDRGGVIVAHNPKGLLIWRDADGQWFSKVSVTLPPRPYMEPGREASLDAFRDLAKAKLTEAVGG